MTNTVFEDDDFRAILDASPATKGHTIIIPKKHYMDLIEIPDELAAKSMVVAKNLAKLFIEKLECEGVNIVQNNGEKAGQTVFHYHVHVIPRYSNDNAHILWEPGQLVEPEEILKTLKQS